MHPLPPMPWLPLPTPCECGAKPHGQHVSLFPAFGVKPIQECGKMESLFGVLALLKVSDETRGDLLCECVALFASLLSISFTNAAITATITIYKTAMTR